MSGSKPKKAAHTPPHKEKATTHPTPNSITEENPAPLAIPWRAGKKTEQAHQTPRKGLQRAGNAGNNKRAYQGQISGQSVTIVYSLTLRDLRFARGKSSAGHGATPKWRPAAEKERGGRSQRAVPRVTLRDSRSANTRPTTAPKAGTRTCVRVGVPSAREPQKPPETGPQPSRSRPSASWPAEIPSRLISQAQVESEL
jgi:hypothetical protein